MKQKILSQENENDNTRLEELSKLIKNSTGEEKSTISCLKYYSTTNESSTKDSNKQILKQSDENSEISLKLKTTKTRLKKIKEKVENAFSLFVCVVCFVCFFLIVLFCFVLSCILCYFIYFFCFFALLLFFF